MKKAAPGEARLAIRSRLPEKSVVLRQHVAMRGDEFVAHLDDVVDGKFGTRVRIEHGGLIDPVALLRERGFDCQELDVDIGHVECGALGRQFADIASLDAVAVDEARNFDHRVRGQVRDEAVVQHVAADLNRLVRDNCLHDARAVLVRELVGEVRIAGELFVLLLPVGDLFDTSSRVLVERNVVLFDEFRIFRLDPVGLVFGIVFARFGDVIAETAHHFDADHIAGLLFRIFGGAPQGDLLVGEFLEFRIEITAVLGDREQPGHVVDAGDERAEVFRALFIALPFRGFRAGSSRRPGPNGRDRRS